MLSHIAESGSSGFKSKHLNFLFGIYLYAVYWSFNLSVFIRVEYGSWPHFTDQNDRHWLRTCGTGRSSLLSECCAPTRLWIHFLSPGSNYSPMEQTARPVRPSVVSIVRGDNAQLGNSYKNRNDEEYVWSRGAPFVY